MFFTKDLNTKVKKIIALAQKHKIRITCAESCTGGLLSALFTENSGSSEVFECGFVVYSNSAKSAMLKINSSLITKYGAVSKEVAKYMAVNSSKYSKADLSVAITGIAGPKGGSKNKPVGLVYIASFNQKTKNLIVEKFNFKGSRSKVRKQSLIEAIEMLNSQLKLF